MPSGEMHDGQTYLNPFSLCPRTLQVEFKPVDIAFARAFTRSCCLLFGLLDGPFHRRHTSVGVVEFTERTIVTTRM